MIGDKRLISESGNMKIDKLDTGTLSLEEVNDIEKFRNLKESWNELLQQSSDNNIFLTWEWLFNWWKYYRGDKKLRIIIIKEADKIIGIAPLMEKTYRQGFISAKVLENLCSEECDYSGIILAERKHESLFLFLDYLARIVKKENMIVKLYQIPNKSTSLTLLREQYLLFSKTLYIEEKPSRWCRYILLPATWDEYFSTLSQRGRRNLRRSVKMLEKDHEIAFKKYAGGNDLQNKLNVFFELHQKRWGKESKFNKPEAREFYISLSQAFCENNWLDLSFLNMDGKPVSLLWGFIYNDIFWAMTNAVDTDYSDYGVGNVHWMKSIEDNIQHGLRKYDFLKGEEAYKQHWTNYKTENIRITMAQRNIRGKYRSKLLQILIKYGNARTRSFSENISLVLKKIKPPRKTNDN